MKNYNLPYRLIGNLLLFMFTALVLLGNTHCKKDKQVKATDCAKCWKKAWPGVYALTSLKYGSLETKQMFENLYGADCRFLVEYVEPLIKGDFNSAYYDFNECLKISISTSLSNLGYTYLQPTKIRWPFRIMRGMGNSNGGLSWTKDTLTLHSNLVNTNSSGIILQPETNKLTLIFLKASYFDSTSISLRKDTSVVFKVELLKITE